MPKAIREKFGKLKWMFLVFLWTSCGNLFGLSEASQVVLSIFSVVLIVSGRDRIEIEMDVGFSAPEGH